MWHPLRLVPWTRLQSTPNEGACSLLCMSFRPPVLFVGLHACMHDFFSGLIDVWSYVPRDCLYRFEIAAKRAKDEQQREAQAKQEAEERARITKLRLKELEVRLPLARPQLHLRQQSYLLLHVLTVLIPPLLLLLLLLLLLPV